MKVYTNVVIDMDNGNILDADWFEYDGPVALCGGGGGKDDSADYMKDYNKGLLKLSEEQQGWAEEMFNMYKYGVIYNPTEKVHGGNMIENPDFKEGSYKKVRNPSYTPKGSEPEYIRKWVPNEGSRMMKDPDDWTTQGDLQGYDADSVTSQMELDQDILEGQSDLLPHEIEAAKAGLGLATTEAGEREKLLKERTPLVSNLYKSALKGINIADRVSRAQADVQHAFKNSAAQTARGLSRYGINPGSGRGLSALGNTGAEKAKAMASATTNARVSGEAEDFERKRIASGII